MKCKTTHTWETQQGLDEDNHIIKGIRKCSKCGYTPLTQRIPLTAEQVERYKTWGKSQWAQTTKS